MKISGTPVISYTSEETGWCVGKIHNAKVIDGTLFEQDEYNRQTITFVGTPPMPIDGIDVEITGEMIEGKYGMQLKAEHFVVIADKDSLYEMLLRNGMVTHVGPITARAILNKWGSDYPEHMNETDLLTVQGIGPITAPAIASAWKRVEENFATIAFSLQHGLSFSLSQKVFEKWGDKAQYIIEEHPYRIVEVSGIGWKTAERLAEAAGIAKDDPERYIYGAEYVLKQQEMDGHTYTTHRVFDKAIKAVLSEYDTSIMDAHLASQENRRVVVLDNGYQRTMTARVIRSVVDRISALQLLSEQIQMQLPLAAFNFVDETQLSVVESVFKNGVTALTGGAGSGKTQTIKAVVMAAEMAGKTVALIAPTGMAADRMSAVTGKPAATIHRALKIFPGKYWEEAGNMIEEDIVIVDETSMVDIFLAEKILRATKNGSHILFVGDAYQLPSVGPGEFFLSITVSEQIPTTVLRKIYRTEGRGIVENANKLRHVNNREELDFTLPGIKHARINKIEDIIKAIPDDYTLLAGFRYEVATANKLLQDKRNPHNERVKFTNDLILSVDDPIRIKRNDYDLMVFNGQRGMIRWIRDPGHILSSAEYAAFGSDLDDVVMEIEMNDGRLITMTKAQVKKLVTLAYASTIHSAQGNEWDKVAVIVPYSKNPHVQRTFLTASILYTAMTRPKKELILIERDSKALKHYRTARAFSRRRTTLLDELKTLNMQI